MELRQLKYFLKAKELSNFTEAAKELYITQSTLSQQIKQLEIELDTLLFNRVGKRVTLTEAGELFAQYAQQSIKKSEEGKSMLSDLNNLQVGTLTIGVTLGLQRLFTKAVLEFALRYPHIRIEAVFGASHRLVKDLENMEMDMVLVFNESRDNPNYIYKALFDSPLAMVSSVHSPYSYRKSITLKEMEKLPLLVATKGFSTDHVISRAFAQQALKPTFHMEINDIPTALELVKSGNWHSILVQASVLDKDLVTIPIADIKQKRTAMLIRMQDTYQKKAMKAFQELLEEYGNEGG